MINGKKLFLEQLRQKAEKLLENMPFGSSDSEAAEVQRLFQELQIHQLELEMQNDELQSTSAELEVQKENFASLFKLAPVGYLILNNKAAIVDINATGCKLLNLRKDLLKGKLFTSFISVDDVDNFLTFFTTLSNLTEQSCQVGLYKINQESLYVQINGICIAEQKANLTYYLTLTNITDKKISEQKLNAAKMQLDMALHASLTGIWEIDIATGKVYLDNFACSMFDIDPEGFDNNYGTLLSMIHPDYRDLMDASFRQVLITEKELNIEFKLAGHNISNRYIAAKGKLLNYGSQQRRFAGTVTNITEKKQMELETQKLKENQQLLITSASLQAEENERKRISETLHDSIGQMLYAIKLNLPPVIGNDELSHIGQLLDKVIRDVRNISFELAPSILNDFGLAATLHEMAKRLSSAKLSVTAKIVGLNRDLDTSLALNIFRIVQELVNNSIKHSGGDKVNITLIQRGQQINIQVADNGKGFKTAHPAQTTAGTGLSSIRNRLNLYSGTINISSKPGEGTTVAMELHISKK